MNNLLLKLDIEKAFDKVAWQFLLEVLQHMGFGDRWRAWITMLLSSALTCILLNGILDQSIWHARGLRQGDALSLMLFIIVMEALYLLFGRVEDNRIIEAFPPMQDLLQRL